MATFRVERKLEPYKITVDLLGDLESYILNELPDRVGTDKETVRDKYALKLHYKNEGTVTLDSIDNYRGGTFENSVEKISLSTNVPQFTLRFGVKGDDNEIRITAKGETHDEARNVANTINDEIKSILRNNKKTTVLLFQPFGTGVVAAGIFVIAVVQGAQLYGFWKNMTTFEDFSPTVFYFALCSLYVLGYLTHPYGWIESNRTKRYASINRFIYLLFVTVTGGLIIKLIQQSTGIF